MNITDVEDVLVPNDMKADMLRHIFAQQREHMEAYMDIERKNGVLQTEKVPVDIDSHAGQARLKDFFQRTIEELCESSGCLKQRPWKQSAFVTDVTHYREELADALHFFVELLILSGIDAEELYRLYFRKSQINKFRRESNY